MATFNYLPFRSTVVYTSAGTLVPDTYMYTVSSSIPTWTNTVAASTLGISTLTLANTAVSLGLSTNSTTVGFSQGNYAAGYWSTASGVSASTVKRVNMSASGQYQTIANQSTNSLYYSNNSGSTWSTLSGISGTITDTGLSASSQNMIVGTASTNVYVSNNYASTFTAKNIGAPFGYFQFENNLNDTQGNMTLTNYGTAVSYVAGQVGTNAVRLTNTAGGTAAQYLRAPWTGASNFTISGWFNVSTLSTTQEILNAYGGNLRIAMNGSNQIFATFPSGGGTSTTSVTVTGVTVAATTWYSFLCIFQTGGVCSISVNNIQGSSLPMNVSGVGTLTSSSITFGSNDAGTSAFNGSLDDIRIFPYAVSPVGPNLYFPFENSTADVVSGATVTVTGTPTYVAGLSTGSALRLTNTTGSNATQYLTVTWPAPTACTISFWFNPAILNSKEQFIFSSSFSYFTIYINTSNQLSAYVPNAGFYINIGGVSATLAINTWYYASFTFQTGGLCALYMNGALIGSVTNSGGFTAGSVQFVVGGSSSYQTYPCFNGSIDDIRIYNTANLYPTATIAKNYPVVAVSGNGQYQLAGTTDGELFLSSDSGASWTVQPSAKILGSWQSLSLSHTGQYMAATASTTQITPNQTSLPSSGTSLRTSPWTQNGVTWVASVNTAPYNTTYTLSNLFNNTLSDTGSWAQLATNYTQTYIGSASTTIQGIGAVLGDWFQLQSSIPLVLQSYAYAPRSAVNLMKSYYIIGSNDGSTWYPLHFMSMSVSPYSAITYVSTNYISMNYTGVQSVNANQAGYGTSTAYSYTTNAYQYFRVIITSVYTTGNTAPDLAEFLPIFTNGSSISTNYGASWAPGSVSSQAVSVPQYTQTTPNQTSLAASTWTQNGVSWTASASSILSGTFYPYYAFNNAVASAGVAWCSTTTYSTSTGLYTGSVSTTVLGITPVVSGEWLQLQTNLPVVLQAYTYSTGGGTRNLPKTYYIVGSNDGSTWYPLQYVSMTANPFPSTQYSSFATTYIQMNYTGTQTIQGTVTGSGSTTAYSYTTNAYTYFRIVSTTNYTTGSTGGDAFEFGEFLPIFVIPTTTTSTGAVLSNAVVSQSGSGQYAIGLDSNIPLVRLTLDNTNADLLGALTPATGAGTVTYSSSVVKVGTHSAFFNNVPGSTTPANYLKYTVPASLNQPSALTMSYWIYPTSFGLQGQNVGPISLGNDPNASINFYFTPSGVVSLYWTSTTSPGSSLTSATTISLNTWTHFAFTFGSGVINMYINGACVVSAAATGNLCGASSTNINTIYVGTTTSTFASFLGYIDDVRIYTTALSSLQIANFYSNPAYQAVKVSSSTIAGLSSTAVATTPALAGLSANVIASAVSFTGQYMVLVTAGTTNNVYYSINYGATFTALTIGSSAMVSCAISADGSYINVANDTTSYRLNNNSSGYTLAIGSGAGAVNQASNAIAIGNGAGAINQSANSIILNASGSALNSVESGFYVAPILAASAASASSSVALLGYGSDSQVVQSSVTVLSNGNITFPSGNVGIGTTNPVAAFQVYNGLYVLSSGNVGIGTANPGSTFHLYGNGGSTNGFSSYLAKFQNSASSPERSLIIGADGTSAMIQSVYNGTSNAYLSLNPLGGNVGIGIANPAWPVTMGRNISVIGNSSGGALAIAGDSNEFQYIVYPNPYTSGLSWWSADMLTGRYRNEFRVAWYKETHGSPLGSAYKDAITVYLYDSGGYVGVSYIKLTGQVNIASYTSNGTVTTINSSGQLSISSDRRIKENIVYITDTQTALSQVNHLKPATFTLKDSDGTHFGFIAQDVEEYIPLAVDGKKYEWQWETDENGKPKFDADGNIVYKLDADGNRIIRPRGLTDRALIAAQTLAIQELSKQTTSQSERIQELSAENASLKSQIQSQGAQIASLLAWAQAQGYSA